MNKKIMIFIPSLEYGGAERVTTYIVKFFLDQGHDIILITKHYGEKEYVLDIRAKRFQISGIKGIRKCLKIQKPDLALVMFAPMAIYIIPALAGMNIPCIISERNDPKHFAGKKIVKILYQLCMKRANGLVFQTYDAMKYYEKKLKGKKCVIYNPLVLNGFPEPFDGRKRQVIINVGRLHYQKNQKLLINAFSHIHKKFSDYSLEIYGEGEMKEKLENYVKSMELEDCVTFMGNHSDILNKEKDAEIFVLSSDFEGMPNALIEAMALGMPVVSTDCPCGGPRELIKDHINGSLVPVGDEKALVNAISELIENSKLKKKYSSEAVKIRELLNADSILREWESFCLEIIGDN